MAKTTKPTRTGVKGGLSRRQFVAAGAATAAATTFMPKRIFAQSKTTVKLTLAWLPQGTTAWTYAALPYWEKEGIEVLIEKGSGSALAVQQIAQGQYEFGIPASPNAIQNAIKGLPLMSLSTAAYDTSMGIAVLDDSPIKTPSDLAGTTVGSTLASGEYPFLPAFYKNVGVDPSTIESVALDNKVRERSLLDGQVDAISCFGTSAVPKILAAGQTPRVFLFSKFGLPFYGQSLTTSQDFFAKEKSLCEAVTRGLNQGIKDTFLQPGRTIDMMVEQVPEFRMSTSSREQAEIGLGLWAALSMVPESMENSIGYCSPETYAKMTDIIYESSSQPGDEKPDASTLFTNEFVGDVTLTKSEWTQVKETFGKYSAMMS